MSRKSGQHFLINKSVSERIVKSLDLQNGDIVIEIGLGTGTSISPLLEECKKLKCELIAKVYIE